MTRLLITGATGFLGVPCVRAASEHFEVHAVARGGGLPSLQPEGLGQHSPGQRPGVVEQMNPQPEGLRQTLSQAFSLEEKSLCEPGALPQAALSQPFGLKPVRVTGSHSASGSPCRIHFHPCDLLNTSETTRLIEDIRPTHLLHLAWVATPGVYWTSPENHRWVDASKRLLLAFARCGGARAVITGTCAEYDWSAAGACREFHTPTRPHTTYGRCKLELAKWALTFGRQRGVRIAWARMFWMYGPREHPARLVPSVARALLAGLPAACSAGTQQRDFLHVDDAADALIALAKSELVGPVNIGSGMPVAVRSVIEQVANACGRPELVRPGERAILATEPPTLVADVERLHNELNWRPRFDLASGLRECVEWWRQTEEKRKCG
ncbi:MAG: NAD(P)-dependent oxidoreductase [Planctomycetia bacterium]|nr:NAD(P)-dependent oxidoreductase [Planctomycetia bacterium]